jgi:nitroreductase
MDVSAAIKGRRSVRSYKDQEIENDKIERILEAGRLPPSANNRQE